MRNCALPLLAALTALTLSACQSDPDSAPPPSTPPTSPSTPPTPSTTPKPPPPTIPPAATAGLTVTSAEAFARFYLAALDHLVATGDGQPIRRWSMPTCETCKYLHDSYRKTYTSGGAITGSTHTEIVRVASVDLVGRDRAKVVFNAKVGSSVWKPSATASPTPLAGANQRWDFYLTAQSGHWVTQALNLTE
jgi:Family of unknown function (DUF6318)